MTTKYKLNDRGSTGARLNARTPVLLQAAVLTAADFFFAGELSFFGTTAAGHAFKHRGACIQKKKLYKYSKKKDTVISTSSMTAKHKLNDRGGAGARLYARTPAPLRAAVLTAADFFLRVNCFF